MKVFTYNNITNGRENETIHAESEKEVIDTMKTLGYDVVITDVFDPDAVLGGAQTIPVPGEPPLPDINQPIQPIQQKPVESKPIFFETNGIKFKIVDGVVFRKDWIKCDDKSDYKIVKTVKIKGDKTREQVLTDDVDIYINDWVEVEQENT